MKDRISYIIAGNPNTPVRVLNKLASCLEPEIRRHVAENKMTPLSLLAKLARDSDPEVKVSALLSIGYPNVSLLQACLSDDVDARYMLAEEPQVPVEVLRILSQDSNPFVATRAKDTLSMRARS